MTDFKSIEEKWQKKWQESKIFAVSENSKKKKFYCLEMFPYPSASFLHMGHVRNYTIGDAIARFKRMNGYNVLYPMGYDSFGLPAENAAKKQKINPREYTENAIKEIKKYQIALGSSYDWDRTISTHEPKYYRWNQYFFLKFLEKGLVYRKKAPVNWCPACNSVLANEEVVDGKCWRHEETEVEKKELEQWFLKITDYADELLTGIDKLEWSDRIKTLQKNWIGKSEGTLAKFKLKDSKEHLEIFTTRIDTIFSVTFLVIAPEHPKALEFVKGTKNEKQALEFIKKVSIRDDKTDLSKEGFFTEKYAINPANGKEIPIYLANFVLMDYGTGIVMADAHDQRDYEFAKKYNIPLVKVLKPKDGNEWKEDKAFEGYGILYNSDQFNGLTSEEAIPKIRSWLESKKLGSKTTQYKLRDWLISRQRYWGTPIPIVYCNKCGTVPVQEKELPVLLPDKVDFSKEGNPLNHVKDWVETKCPKCKSSAKRETDTMGGFVDSSWYFLRYCSPTNEKEAFDKKAVDYWMPVDQYIGGIEHAVGHLIYSRFWTKALRDFGMLKFDEPFTKLFNQGIVYKDGHKMSKSFGNIVYQTDISQKYGIDTARVFLMSVASPESDMEWTDTGVEGSSRFLQKVERISEQKFAKETEKDSHKRNSAIKKYTELFENFKFNMAIIQLMQYADYLSDNPTKEGYEDLLKTLSPFAPHTAEELWSKLGNKNFISLEKWPSVDLKKIKPELEIAEKLVQSIISDVNNVLKLAKIEKPAEISLFVAEKWKYSLYDILKVQLEKTRDIKEIMKAVMSTELKRYGQEVQKIIPRAAQHGLLEFLKRENELKTLEESKKEIEKQFNCEVEIILEENSKEQKAKQSMPGKVAIVVK